jgi:rubredoxin
MAALLILTGSPSCLPGNSAALFQTTSYAERRGWESDMKKWQCVICGFIYDEALGWPEEGIAPGTRWEDIPADWQCPDCGAAKADFEMIEL